MKIVRVYIISSILLLFTKSSKAFTAPFSAGQAATFGATYALYSLIIDKYASRVVENMKTVPSPKDIQQNSDLSAKGKSLLTPTQLRDTVSKRTYIVKNCHDRLSWNEWIASKTSTSVDLESILSLCNIVHKFKYRSYVNFEESGAISKPFFTWKRFGFMLRKPGELTFSREMGQKASSEKEDRSPLLFVTNTEHFLLGVLAKVTIQWYGKVIKQSDNDGFCIQWNKTLAVISLLGKKIVKENPKVSSELSAFPWQITGLEDGLLCFQRGDIGHLVYDSK